MGRNNKGIKEYIAQHVDLSKPPIDEARRLMAELNVKGISTTLGSLQTGIRKFRQEKTGRSRATAKRSRWGTPLRQSPAQEVGFAAIDNALGVLRAEFKRLRAASAQLDKLRDQIRGLGQP